MIESLPSNYMIPMWAAIKVDSYSDARPSPATDARRTTPRSTPTPSRDFVGVESRECKWSRDNMFLPFEFGAFENMHKHESLIP
jgi:hypothetical protein